MSSGKLPGTLGAVDVVFPVLHGPYGEDGTIQGMLELAGIPYVGSGVLASAVGMDKITMKKIFAHHGLPQVGWLGLTRKSGKRTGMAASARSRHLGLPVLRQARQPRLQRRHQQGRDAGELASPSTRRPRSTGA